jgi:hypothetical protein
VGIIRAVPPQRSLLRWHKAELGEIRNWRALVNNWRHDLVAWCLTTLRTHRCAQFIVRLSGGAKFGRIALAAERGVMAPKRANSKAAPSIDDATKAVLLEDKKGKALADATPQEAFEDDVVNSKRQREDHPTPEQRSNLQSWQTSSSTGQNQHGHKKSTHRKFGPSTAMAHCWGLVLKCYELRTRQHKKC